MRILFLTIAVIVAAVLLTACTKEEYCARLANIEVIDNSDRGFEVEGEGGTVSVVVHDMISFEYDNGNKYLVVRAGEDYSHLSDLNECELQELGFKPYLKYN